MILLLNNGKIKNIKDTNDISRYITNKVKYIMINVGINKNSEYIILDPKHIIKKINNCTLEYSLSCYGNANDIEYEYYENECIEPYVFSNLISISINTIEQFYSYIHSFYRIEAYNLCMNELDFQYNGPIEISNFYLKIEYDNKVKKIVSNYNYKTMPIEEDNLINIKRKLGFLEIEKVFNDFKRNLINISINFLLNKWRKIKVKKNKRDFNNDEFCGIELFNLKSFYFINKYFYNELFKIEYIYIECIIFQNEYYFLNDQIKSRMNTIIENHDFFNYFSYQIGNVQSILSFFSFKNNLFKLFEETSCFYLISREEKENNNYELITLFEIKPSFIKSKKYNINDYEYIYTDNPINVELKDIIIKIKKAEEKNDYIK